MIYTLEQLRELVVPILLSMPRGDEGRAVDAIIELIKQDREAHAAARQ